jgi:hypothetical protein
VNTNSIELPVMTEELAHRLHNMTKIPSTYVNYQEYFRKHYNIRISEDDVIAILKIAHNKLWSMGIKPSYWT